MMPSMTAATDTPGTVACRLWSAGMHSASDPASSQASYVLAGRAHAITDLHRGDRPVGKELQ
jgi:hypothetical protein